MYLSDLASAGERDQGPRIPIEKGQADVVIWIQIFFYIIIIIILCWSGDIVRSNAICYYIAASQRVFVRFGFVCGVVALYL